MAAERRTKNRKWVKYLLQDGEKELTEVEEYHWFHFLEIKEKETSKVILAAL